MEDSKKYIERLESWTNRKTDTPLMIEATKVAIKKLKNGSSIKDIENWLVKLEKFERSF